MAASTIDTVALLAVPLCATPAWKAAVDGADGHCQCEGCGKTHRATGGHCGNRQGLNGTRLHLAPDGKVYCGPCFPHHNPAKPGKIPDGEQGDLIALLASG